MRIKQEFEEIKFQINRLKKENSELMAQIEDVKNYLSQNYNFVAYIESECREGWVYENFVWFDKSMKSHKIKVCKAYYIDWFPELERVYNIYWNKENDKIFLEYYDKDLTNKRMTGFNKKFWELDKTCNELIKVYFETGKPYSLGNIIFTTRKQL